MSNRKFLSGLSLILSSFLLTGCYTQLQSMDYTERAGKRGIHNDYYSWNSDREVAKESASAPANGQSITASEVVEDPTMEVEVGEIHYKDYETAQWYEDNFADRLYWNGYDEGFEDGYEEGREDGYEDATYEYWDAHFYSLRTLVRRGYFHSSFHYSWSNHLAFSYYPYYYYDYYWDSFRYPIGGWGYFNDPFYDPFFYGGWGYHHSPYRNYIVVYNDYHQNVNRSRSGRHINGPRSTGLVSRGNGDSDATIRSRGITGNTIRSKTTGRTRTSGITSTGRTRSSETTRTRYTGRTNSTTSRTSGVIVGTNRSKEASSGVKTNRTRSGTQNVGRSSTSRTRSSGVTNTSRGTRSSSGVRSGSSNTGRSSGVRSTGRSGGNNRSVRSSGGSSRSSGVRSSGSSRSRSSGNSSSSTKKTRRSGNN